VPDECQEIGEEDCNGNGIRDDCECIWDLDTDCEIALSDLSILLETYGLCEGDPGYNGDADFDGDGCVYLPDLGCFLAQYGESRICY